MSVSEVRVENGAQIVVLLDDVSFPGGIEKVYVRNKGAERILSPLNNTWDSFFLLDECVTDDFMCDCLGSKNQE